MAKKKRSNLPWIIGGFVLLCAAAYFLRPDAGKEGVLVETEKVEARHILARVSESGTIQPVIEVEVAPDVSGEIVELYIREGQQVKKGEPLVSIQPDNYQADLEQARAGLNQSKASELRAKAAIEQARANVLQDSVNLVRTQQLFEQNVAAKVELENARLKYKISKSQLTSSKFSAQSAYFSVKNAEALTKKARQNLSRTRILAPMDGVVTMLGVEVGNRVVGTSMMSGTIMLKIADLSSMEVIVEINENDIVNLSLGDSAKIEVDAYPDHVFYGKISELAYSAKGGQGMSIDQVTNFEVKVVIAAQSYAEIIKGRKNMLSPFRPGMTAQIEIYSQEAHDAISVPIQAVVLSKKEDDEEDEAEDEKDKKQQVVYVIEEGIAREQNVSTGISDDKYIHIKTGLKAGAEIVVGSYTVLNKMLKDSTKIRIEE